MEIFQIAKLTIKLKLTILSIEDKIAICECFDKGYFKRDIACEYKITVFKSGARRPVVGVRLVS